MNTYKIIEIKTGKVLTFITAIGPHLALDIFLKGEAKPGFRAELIKEKVFKGN